MLVARLETTTSLSPSPLTSRIATPEGVARDILRTIERGRFSAYLPGYWRPSMAVVRNLPEPVFQRIPFLSGR